VPHRNSKGVILSEKSECPLAYFMKT